MFEDLPEGVDQHEYRQHKIEKVFQFIKKDCHKFLIQYLTEHPTDVYGVRLFDILIERVLKQNYKHLLKYLDDYDYINRTDLNALIAHFNNIYYKKRNFYYKGNRNLVKQQYSKSPYGY